MKRVTDSREAMGDPCEESLTADRRRSRRWAMIALAVLLFVLASGDHVLRSLDPMWFNDDARQQVWPFLGFHDPQLFQGDVVADYYLRCLPTGYQAIYRLTAPLVDPRVTSKVVPYLTYAVLLAGVWLACRGIGGRAAAWLGVFTVLASGVFLERMSGGLPRSFAAALVAVAAAAVVNRKPGWLAATAVAGAAFYPSAGVVLGVTLAGYAMVWPGLRSPSDGRRRWVLAAGLTVATAIGCLAAIALPARGSAAYGGRIGVEDFDRYPEAGFNGRFKSQIPTEKRQSYLRVGSWCVASLVRDVGSPQVMEKPATLLVLFVAMGGGILILTTRPSSCGLVILVVASAATYYAADWLFPALFWPSRYVEHVVPVILVIVGSTSLVEVLKAISGGRVAETTRGALVVVPVMFVLFVLAAAPAKRPGLNVSSHNRAALFEFMNSLPVDAVIAGWPVGWLQSVRYCSGRQVLVDYENHLAFHRRFIEMMRPRARLSIEATLSTEDAALRRLHEEYGVTHFVHSPRIAEQRPYYFEPFNDLIAELREARADRPYAAERLAQRATVFRERRLVVIDLEMAFAGEQQTQ